MTAPDFDYLRSTTQTISWFNNTHTSKQLVLAPPFQRKPVWTNLQKSMLIDTILRGYPIPEIYMQHSLKNADGIEKYIVVDGQQRLRACLEFLSGDFEIRTKGDSAWDECAFEDLSRAEQIRILSYQLVVRMLPDVDDLTIRSVFKRLNQHTVILNKQELRHATYIGRFITTATELAELDYWSEFGLFSANAIRRMLDIEFISELMILTLHGVQNKKQSLDKWYNIYEEQEFPEEHRIRRTFDIVLSSIDEMLPLLRKSRWRKRSDFYTLFGVLTKIQPDLPFGARESKRIGRLLLAFAEEIDLRLGVVGRYGGFRLEGISNSELNDYTRAVERAASDIGNRRTRERVLLSLLDYESE